MPTDPTLFLDSFDAWTTAGTALGKWTSGTGTPDSTIFRTGTQSLKIIASGEIYKDWGGNVLNLGSALYIHKTGGTASDAHIFQVFYTIRLIKQDEYGNTTAVYLSDGSSLFRILWNTATFSHYLNNSFGFNAPGGARDVEYPNADLIYYDAWFHVQLIYQITKTSSTSFTMESEFFVNEKTQGTITAGYSMNTTEVNDGWLIDSVYITGFSLGQQNWGNTSNYYDDLFASSSLTVPMGDLKIMVLRPMSDVDKEWTPSTGTDNFEMVNDEFPDGDSTYNYDTTVGNKDTFEMEDTGLLGTTLIAASQAVIYVRKEEAGEGVVTLDAVQSAVRSELLEIYPGQDYVASTVDTTDLTPTAADVDSLQLGYTKKV